MIDYNQWHLLNYLKEDDGWKPNDEHDIDDTKNYIKIIQMLIIVLVIGVFVLPDIKLFKRFDVLMMMLNVISI